MRPSPGLGPYPKNDNVDSARIAPTTDRRQGHHDRAERVRDEVAEHDARSTGTDRARRLDELAFFHDSTTPRTILATAIHPTPRRGG